MRRWNSLLARWCVAVSIVTMQPMAGPYGPSVASAVPALAISMFPGVNSETGWYTTAPEVTATTDSTGEVRWWWEGGSVTTVAVTAGIPRFLADAPEGTSVLNVYAVDGLGVPSALVTETLKVDSVPPSIPASLTAMAHPHRVELSWDPAIDTGSGVAAYNVYRNTTGLPLGPADLVATIPTTRYSDVTPAGATYLYYAVQAVDVAGSWGILTAALPVVPDNVPPTAPGDLQAWLNASGWCRVSWTSSVDVGSGLAGYRVRRALDGGPMSQIATAGPATSHYADLDPAIQTAVSVEYEVIAVDRVGLHSPTAGPVPMGVDTTPPGAPTGVTALPVYSDAPANARFDLAWTPGMDAGSGRHLTWIGHGDTPGVPDHEVELVGGSVLRVSADTPTALWHFQIRQSDRAGNISPWTEPVSARSVATRRVHGSTRIGTALAISAASFAEAGTVVVASAASFPDALAASGLAGAVNGPVILVGPGPIPAETRAEIARLGAVDAFVVGGTRAVSAETAASLDGLLSGRTVRLPGADRYATAALVADEISFLGGGRTPARVYVTSGHGFADALSAGPAAFVGRDPVLFANRGSVPTVTIEAIARLGATRTVVLGGTGAVTPNAEKVLPGVVRVFGADRYATSVEFARWAVANVGLTPRAPVVASGRSFPDGLAAAPLAGTSGSVVLLAREPAPTSTAQWLREGRAVMSQMTVVGGELALPDTVRRALWASVSVP